MHSINTQHKASKASVQIKNSNGRLQLAFSHRGKRHYLSLGLPDNKVNRKAAQAKASLIESDIAFDRFDPTLAKYKPQLALSTVTPITPIFTPKPYQTRHTFITLALDNGLDAKDVARLVGNSPEIIYRHYAGNKQELFVPEF